MRDLAQPRVLKAAASAAFVSALASYPRLALWPNRVYPLWYLEALLFLGGTVLWLVRLVSRPAIAAIMTAFLGMFVLWFKNDSSKTPLPAGLLMAVLSMRLVVGLVSVYFLLRGGVLLVWWWSFLVQTRHVLDWL